MAFLFLLFALCFLGLKNPKKKNLLYIGWAFSLVMTALMFIYHISDTLQIRW